MAATVFLIEASKKLPEAELSRRIGLVYQRLGPENLIEKGDLTAVKIHFGEQGTTGYIKPAWLTAVVDDLKKRKVRAFWTDTNTLYVGRRSNAVEHLQLAQGHGFSLERTRLPVLIADGLIGRDGLEFSVDLPRVKTAKIARAFAEADAFVCLSHFTGHILTGFGAALKNLGMGCASRQGKLEQHSDVHPWIDSEKCIKCLRCLPGCPTGALQELEESVAIQDEHCIGCGECLVLCQTDAVRMQWDREESRVQEKMAEYGLSVHRLFKGKALYINVILDITKDCDCMSQNSHKIAEDIGIAGSLDPVALDQASVDLVLKKCEADVLREANPPDWRHQLEHAEKIGLGSRSYELVALNAD
ncbi:MAG: DUF362 domain-containing protein [Acidobacteria bacterium]|nr:DUF362 domain-containing protein [Acidobacteriota bacterium]MCG2816598.1 DUF362 domain-containing protein [Candidatus Aminicenantes bacterium]MBU1339280.1 DUF362 domain-containing protein [Acidobacteriota bacterium]MBU1474496.1 DUF362 domain-containing protein [Acidobacteriota bacterium]MBU4255454.1 DUF362 domain-containing protein [Acidobacteriota bacterium]